jgi:transposase
MTLIHDFPDRAVLVAIDVAKHRNEIPIEVPGRARRRRLTVLNTKADHDRFIETLATYRGPVVSGFEATGNYHRPPAHRLLAADIELRLISALALAPARTREPITSGRDKNDPKDAQIILHTLRIGHVQRSCDPLVHGLVDIQELSKTHEAISKTRTELWHRLLTPYLPLHFPEAERFRGEARSDWVFAFLELFPIPAMIPALEKDAFIAAAWDVVGRKVAKHRLLSDFTRRQRHRSACRSIPHPTPLPCSAWCSRRGRRCRSIGPSDDGDASSGSAPG